MISRKNRGMLLEKLINKTLLFYEKNDVALIHKKQLNIKFSKVEKKTDLKIKNGKIIKKSTVDYYGLYNGFFLAFEAKSTEEEKLNLTNLKPHQRKYLATVTKLGGIAFLIIFFKKTNEIFLVFEQDISKEKKYLDYSWINKKGTLLTLTYPGYLNIIETLHSKFF